MRIRHFLLGSVFLAGCAKDVTKDIEDLADRACACADKKDVACGEAVVTDLVKLAQANKNAKGDESKAAAAARRMGDCLLKTGMDPQKLATELQKAN
ncbi:MAG: hypothetical protein H6Q90_2472 [Deltaproteobacteria bacterium]|nr:hypothetical protein [Deltaproteobacteria bacterium]